MKPNHVLPIAIVLLSFAISVPFFLRSPSPNTALPGLQAPSPSRGICDLRGSFDAQTIWHLSDGWLYHPALSPALNTQYKMPETEQDSYAAYQITLLLDSEPRQYALEAPQLYGHYRLWINGNLFIDTAEQTARSLPSTLIFEASQRADIVLITTDKNGTIHPLVFGAPMPVQSTTYRRLLATFCQFVFSLILVLFGLPFGIWINKLPLTLSQLFLCLFCALSISRVMIQILIFPCNAVRALLSLSYHAMFPCLILTYGLTFQLPKWWLFLLTSCGSAYLLCDGVAIFLNLSHAAPAFLPNDEGWCTVAACILVVFSVAWSIKRRAPLRPFFLASAGIVAASLFVTALFPTYQNSFFQWPFEIAVMLHSSLSAVSALFDIIHLYFEKIHLQAEEAAARLTAAVEAQKYETLVRQMEHTRIIRHEIRSQLMAPLASIQAGQYRTAEQQLLASLGESTYRCYTANPLINTVLIMLMTENVLARIDFQYDISAIPTHLPIGDSDLCSLLNNMLENAIEGCDRLPVTAQRSISLTLKTASDFFYINCRNTCPDDLIIKVGRYRTTKAEPSLHGLGVRRMQQITQKYGGLLHIAHKNTTFHLEAALPLKSAAE